MKIIYQFDEDDEADKDNRAIFECAFASAKALWEIDSFCRSKLKYTEGIPEREAQWLEQIRDLTGEANLPE